MSIANRLARQSSAVRQGGAFWKPKDGENIVRLLPFTHVVTDGDFKLGRFDEADGVKAGDKVEELFVPFRKHMDPQPGPCGKIMRADGYMVGECPACDHATKLKSSPAREDQQLGRKHEARVKYAVNVVDVNDPSKQVMCWDAPGALQQELSKLTKLSIYQRVSLWGIDGCDILVNYNSKSQDPKGYYGFVIIPRQESKQLAMMELKGEIRDLLAVRTYLPAWAHAYLDSAPPKPAPAGVMSVLSRPPEPAKAAPAVVETKPEPTPAAPPAAAAPAPAKRTRKPKEETPKAPEVKTVRFHIEEGNTASEIKTATIIQKLDDGFLQVSVTGADGQIELFEISPDEVLKD